MILYLPFGRLFKIEKNFQLNLQIVMNYVALNIENHHDGLIKFTLIRDCVIQIE